MNFPKSLITFYWTQKSCFVPWFETNTTSEQTRTETKKKTNVQVNKQKTQTNISKKVAHKKNK
jgi:hypothetical protein